MNYTYILECGDNSLYTGWTTDIDKRVKCHNSGKGAKYTRGRGPITLRYFETFETRQQAMKREYEIKKLNREKKLKLISEGSGQR